ncbi:MAG: hypothetical protein ACRDOM_09690, partial [Nocardioides sp.]
MSVDVRREAGVLHLREDAGVEAVAVAGSLSGERAGAVGLGADRKFARDREATIQRRVGGSERGQQHQGDGRRERPHSRSST